MADQGDDHGDVTRSVVADGDELVRQGPKLGESTPSTWWNDQPVPRLEPEAMSDWDDPGWADPADPVGQTTVTYRSLGLADLAALDVPELDWVVDGLFPAGSLTLFAGREKEGKSLAVLDAAASVAGGEEWAGRATTTGPVVYCPAEDSVRTVRDRLRKRIGDDLAADGRPLRVMPLTGVAIRPGEAAPRLDLNRPEEVAGLRRVVEEFRPVLLVLDCLRELHAARENESDDMTVTLRPLRQLAHELHVAVIVVHHASKGSGGSRGSTATAAACDSVATWVGAGDGADESRPDGEASEAQPFDAPGVAPLRATLTVRGREVPKTEIRLELGDDLRFRPVSVGFASAARRRIFRALGDSQWWTAAEIASTMDTPEATVRNTLSALLTDPDARIERSAPGRRGAPAQYRLAPDLPPDPTMAPLLPPSPPPAAPHAASPEPPDDDGEWV